MKRYLYLLILLLPAVACAQQSWYKSVLSDCLWMNVGDAAFSEGEVSGISLAFSPSHIPYVAYKDLAYSQKATVMSFNGTDWENIGPPGFSASGVNYTSLAFSPNGEPYLAYQDFNQSSKASVMKFNGTDWVDVGTPGFSADIASYTSLAINSTGEPYVAYGDKGNSWKATVMKFDGNNWVNVGLPGFSAGNVLYTCLALNKSGVPYVAFNDLAYSHKASVMKLEGTNWVYVGAPGFSAGESSYLSLAFSPSEQPYLAFVDMGNSHKATVMMFDGNTWVNVGSAGFTPNAVTCTSIAFSPVGEPYVALAQFIPLALTYKAVVMKFEGTGINWVNVGTPGFSVDNIQYPSLAFSPAGQPYVAFVDNGNSSEATVMKYDSIAVGINEPTKSGLFLYPNPATTKLTIDLKTTPGKTVTYEITDLRGMTIIEAQTSENQITVNVNNYPPGIYFVRLKEENSTFFGIFYKN